MPWRRLLALAAVAIAAVAEEVLIATVVPVGAAGLAPTAGPPACARYARLTGRRCADVPPKRARGAVEDLVREARVVDGA